MAKTVRFLVGIGEHGRQLYQPGTLLAVPDEVADWLVEKWLAEFYTGDPDEKEFGQRRAFQDQKPRIGRQ